MTRQIDVLAATEQNQGWDMTTNARKTFAHPSMAQGTRHSGLSDGNSAAGCPGGNLGTGMNTDVYTTPTVEAV